MRRRLLRALTNIANEIEANKLPTGYRRVEYLGSNYGQMIRLFVDDSDVDTVQMTLFGGFNVAFEAKGSVPNALLFFVHPSGFRVDYGGARVTYYPYVQGSKNEILFNITTGKLTINGEVFSINKLKDFTLNSRQFLFNDYSGGYTFRGGICSFKMLKGNTAKLHLVACLDPVGAPCMFDLVSRQPFYNDGSGDFYYPTESTTYSLRGVLPDWGKLTPHGLRRLYHAPAGYQGELYDYAFENGYKPIVEPEMPEEGYWSPRWTETDDEIVLEWVKTEAPEEFNFTPKIEDIEE